ncbi:hypothetical protein V8C44DRAFT_333222 [Trichoderma aethiopicum]
MAPVSAGGLNWRTEGYRRLGVLVISYPCSLMAGKIVVYEGHEDTRRGVEWIMNLTNKHYTGTVSKPITGKRGLPKSSIAESCRSTRHCLGTVLRAEIQDMLICLICCGGGVPFGFHTWGGMLSRDALHSATSI